jgi:hypothetical protein
MIGAIILGLLAGFIARGLMPGKRPRRPPWRRDRDVDPALPTHRLMIVEPRGG